MASTREERMQQRLRGAQRREVKDVDFGFTFPAVPAASLDEAPAQPRGHSESNLRADLPSQLSSRSRRSPNPLSTEKHNKSVNDANTSAKRRKLGVEEAPSSSTRSTRSSFFAPRSDIYDIPPDLEDDADAARALDESVRAVTALDAGTSTNDIGNADVSVDNTLPELRGARTPSIQAPDTEEVTESPTHAPGSGHRKRIAKKVVSQSSQIADELQSGTPTRPLQEISSASISTRKRKRATATPNTIKQSSKRSQGNRVSGVDSVIDDLDELSPEQTKSIADELDELSPEQTRGRSRRVRSPELGTSSRAAEEPTEDSGDEAQEVEVEEAAAISKKHRGQRKLRAPSPELDEHIALPKKQKGTKGRQISTPAKQQQPKKKPSRTSQGDAAVSSKSTKKKPASKSALRHGSPIPITVHRLSKQILYDEDAGDADILNSKIPHAKRGGVNAIDVLSRFCEEIIGSSLNTLEEGEADCEDRALRREYRTKWRAVEAFGVELQARLLQHTINLDNAYALEKRVRDEQKKKLALREEILQVRGEREQVALQMDAIRIKHEEETKLTQDRNALNSNIYDIELAVERGKELESESRKKTTTLSGAELLLKRVADEASSKSQTGGALKQIKDFNAFLERAALALEAR